MRSNITLRQLRAFIAVSELRSFTKAGARLGISQPTLTTVIRQLEEALSLRLLDRDTRTVTLTEAGRDFLLGARHTVDNFDALIVQTRRGGELESGKITISALPSISATVLCKSIGRFREDYPGVSVRLYDTTDVNVSDRVLRMQSDFGIGGVPYQHPELAFEPLIREQFYVIFRADHRFSSLNRITTADISGEPMIVQGQRTGIMEVVEAAFAKENLRLNALCEVRQLSTLRAMVESGLGITIVNGTCLPVVASDIIRVGTVADCDMSRVLGIISRREPNLSPAAKKLMTILRADMKRAAHVGGSDITLASSSAGSGSDQVRPIRKSNQSRRLA